MEHGRSCAWSVVFGRQDDVSVEAFILYRSSFAFCVSSKSWALERCVRVPLCDTILLGSCEVCPTWWKPLVSCSSGHAGTFRRASDFVSRILLRACVFVCLRCFCRGVREVRVFLGSWSFTQAWCDVRPRLGEALFFQDLDRISRLWLSRA